MTLVTGRAASPGTASGPVAFITELALDDVPDGAVVVSETTEPWMTPALTRATAIVTDAGGITSHAAVVARELGIPAVVATETATSTLTAGDRVEVDGGEGRVSVLDGRGTAGGTDA